MRIAVVGAGIAGLTAARRLALAGHGCDVYERWPGLGGQVATLDAGDGVLLERYYHHLFTSDSHMRGLYDELGMSSELEWLPSSVAVFADGASHPFTTPLDLLRFRPLDLRSRLRVGLTTISIQRRGGDMAEIERVTARAWINERMGAAAWEKLWGPLLRGKFGDRADEISMAWLWGKLTLRRQIKGREARREYLGYPRGSWQPLLERLRAEIEGRGGRVLIDRPATSIGVRDGGLEVAWGAPDSFRRGLDPRRFERAGGPEPYDAVLATVPSDVFSALLTPGLADRIGSAYLERLESVEYHTALCLLLELDRGFSPFYWTNIATHEIPFVGLIEHTNLLDPERFGGRRFLYVANYLAPGDPLLALDPDELLAAYEPGLRRVNPAYERSWVRNRWSFAEPAAQPLVTVGYPDRIPPLETGVPGLVLANTTQIYPEDRGTNYSVALGERAAEAVSRAAARPTPAGAR